MLKKHIVFTGTLTAAFIIQAASASAISESKSSSVLTQTSIWEKGKGLQGTTGPAFAVAANGTLGSSVADSTVLAIYSSTNGDCTTQVGSSKNLSGSMTFTASNTYHLNKTGLYTALATITGFTNTTMDVRVNPTTHSGGTGLNIFTVSPSACFAVNCSSGSTCTTDTATASVTLTAPTVVGQFFDEGYVYCIGGSCTPGATPTAVGQFSDEGRVHCLGGSCETTPVPIINGKVIAQADLIGNGIN
ncbi:MAG: hypothetical protein NTU49_07740, partial [Gammaproteobacteria bacterium]|nr:hypothetical protein [Gammaproteobacteria bacterium]